MEKIMRKVIFFPLENIIGIYKKRNVLFTSIIHKKYFVVSLFHDWCHENIIFFEVDLNFKWFDTFVEKCSNGRRIWFAHRMTFKPNVQDILLATAMLVSF